MSKPVKANLHGFLARLTSRSFLNEQEQQALLDIPVFAEQIEAKCDFVGLGDRTEHSTLVIHGVVGRFDQNARGARQITAIHITGDMANLGSVVHPKAMSALQALSPSTILHVPHVELRRVAARYPAIAEAFWRDCTVDAVITSQWIMNVSRRDAKTRLAHLLCELGVRFRQGSDTHSVSFPLPVTQVQLADATGMSAVHMNRSVQALARVVALAGGRVEIVEWAKLCEMGDFDPDYLHANVSPEDRPRLTEHA